jgi:hypothetical protein
MSKPVLITRKTLAANAAKRWRASYDPAFVLADGEKAGAIHKALLALGPNPAPDAVDAVIGNTSWTTLDDCDGCGKKTAKLVRVGQEPDYDSRTACLCPRCLRAAMAVLGATP